MLRRVMMIIVLWKLFFFKIIDDEKFRRTAFILKWIFFFTVTFDHFNASLLNEKINQEFNSTQN